MAGRPYEGDEPRTWVCEAAEPYRAGSWSRTRRVVQVLVEEPGELFPRTFWLLTSLPAGRSRARNSWRCTGSAARPRATWAS